MCTMILHLVYGIKSAKRANQYTSYILLKQQNFSLITIVFLNQLMVNKFYH